MSVKLPFVNYQYNGAGAVRYDIPSGGAQKPANTAFVLGCWIRPPDANFFQTRVHTFLGRQGAGTGGNDAYVRFTDNTMSDIIAYVKSGSTVRFNATANIPGTAKGKALLVMIVCTSTLSSLVICEPGGTPIVVSDTTNGSALYAVGMTTTPFMQRLGSAAVHGYYGDVEDYFFIHGTFPNTAGTPDTTLIQNITNGTQDLDTLHSQLTGGTKQCRYKLADEFDVADAWGLQSNLTPVNVVASTGHRFRASGPLRPAPLRPNRTRQMCSQATFPTPGSAAGATATIKVEAGTYTGITPAAIQARLVKEDGSTHVEWTTFDAAPAAGVWAAGQLTGVPLAAGFLRLDIRAVDSGGNQIGTHVTSHGLRGTAAAAYISVGQSQLMHLYGTDPLALPAGINIAVTRQNGAGIVTPADTFEAILSSGCANTDVLGYGMRQAAIEINTLYPGVPIHFMTVGESGQNLNQWNTGGNHAGRWAALAAHVGIVQPTSLLMYGHSNVISADADAYKTLMDNVIALAESSLGTLPKIICCPTPRYGTAGANYSSVAIARDGARKWVDANPGKGFWGGSWSVVKCNSGGVDSGPHPSDDNYGEGRSGALQAWAVLMAARAVEDVPLTLTAAKATGAVVELTFGAANP